MFIVAFGFSGVWIVLYKILDLVSFGTVLDDLLNFLAFGTNYFLFEVGFNILFELEFFRSYLVKFSLKVLGGVMRFNHRLMIRRFDDVTTTGIRVRTRAVGLKSLFYPLTVGIFGFSDIVITEIFLSQISIMRLISVYFSFLLKWLILF